MANDTAALRQRPLCDLISSTARLSWVVAFDIPGSTSYRIIPDCRICPNSHREGSPKRLPRSRRSRPSRERLLPHLGFL
jgi:hypothetical protein